MSFNNLLPKQTMDEDEKEEEQSFNIQPDNYPVPEDDLLNNETMEQILKAKNADKTKFESYWEMDENDIDPWTKQQLQNDPRKRFITMAEEGRLSELKELMKTVANTKELQQSYLEYKDADGYTALHRAAYSNQLEVAKYLLSFEKKNSNSTLNQLNARTDMGWTPLHSAAYWNSYELVEYFAYHANADLNAVSSSGQTPLHIAAQQSTGRETLLLLLLHPLIDYGVKNHQGETAADIAKRSCKYNRLFEMAEDHLNKL